jgi:MraZ protein
MVTNGNSSVSYLGQHLRGVDRGRRIILPPEWRSEGASTKLVVVKWPLVLPEYLLVLTDARWETLRQSLAGLPLSDDHAPLLERLISSRTSNRQIDSYGRLPLPEDPEKQLGIETEAILLGRIDKFEIWNPERLTKTLAKLDAQAVADALKAIKI